MSKSFFYKLGTLTAQTQVALNTAADRRSEMKFKPMKQPPAMPGIPKTPDLHSFSQSYGDA